MRGSRPRVYLAGPITGLSYNGSTEWRDAVAQQLAPRIVAVSPMRGKEYLSHLTDIGGTPAECEAFGNVMSTPKGITARDQWDTTSCDAVLMNLLAAQKVSIGTMIEAGWASQARVPLILVTEPGNIHEHAILHELAGWIVPTLDEAVHILKVMFWRNV